MDPTSRVSVSYPGGRNGGVVMDGDGRCPIPSLFLELTKRTWRTFCGVGGIPFLRSDRSDTTGKREGLGGDEKWSVPGDRTRSGHVDGGGSRLVGLTSSRHKETVPRESPLTPGESVTVTSSWTVTTGVLSVKFFVVLNRRSRFLDDVLKG